MRRSEAGLSLIEVLIAVSLLAIIVLSVSLPITGFFKMNRNSSLSLDATRAAQDGLERARAEVLKAYADPGAALSALSSALPSTPGLTVTLSCADLKADGSLLNASCAGFAAASGPPLRRLTVVASSGGVNEARLSLEVRP